MPEYSDKEVALSAISNWLRKAKYPSNASEYNRGEIAAYETTIEEIRKFPAVNVRKNVKAYWWDIGSLSCRCSNCGCKNNKETIFCPNCGAQMVGGKYDY